MSHGGRPRWIPLGVLFLSGPFACGAPQEVARSVTVLSPPVDTEPERAPGAERARPTSLTCGERGCCAIGEDGAVRCWGMFGDGRPDPERAPHRVTGLPAGVRAVSVSMGDAHTCAVLSDETTWCWGVNHYGQLGDGTDRPHASPIHVPGITGASMVSAHRNSTCVLLSRTTITCWGRVVRSLQPTPIPMQLTGPSRVVQMGVGDFEICARFDDGAVRCTRSAPPSLSDGDPVLVTDAIDLVVGWEHSCAVQRDKGVTCWGTNYACQLAAPLAGGQQSMPVRIPGVRDVVELSLSRYGALAARSDGGVVHWGGDAKQDPDCRPKPVPRLRPMRQIAALESGLCGIGQDAEMQCLGLSLDKTKTDVQVYPVSFP